MMPATGSGAKEGASGKEDDVLDRKRVGDI
jgi:hypothetical protein